MRVSAPRSLAVASALIAAVAAMTLPARAAAQQLPPESIRAIDAVFADIDADAPGCAAGVVADGELVYADGHGLANLDYGLPITARSNFYLGSIGKQFTAAAVALAADQGHLSLDDPVQKWIPAIPEYERPVTVRHLIHHTSGLRDYLGLMSLAGRRLEDVNTVDDVLDLIARQRAPNFPAGDEYLYSNTGYFLLAEIVKRATGRPLSQYAREELLEPLGMTRTRVHDDRRAIIPDRVVGYERDDGEYVMDHVWNFDQIGSGGVYSSIEELAHWDRNYYTEEVGGPGFTERLRERGVLTDGSAIAYAFGLSHGEYRGLETIGHGGSLAGFRSQLVRFPEERTTVVVLCNFPTSDPAGRARSIADVVLADRLEAVADAPEEDDAGDDEAALATDEETAVADLASDQLDAFTGHWRASIGAEVEIRRVGDGLVFVQGSNQAPLEALSDSVLRLEMADITMTMSRMADGRYDFMDVVQRGRAFTAERFDPETDDVDYTPYVGAYHSAELDATYTLTLTDRGLEIENPLGSTTRAYVAANGSLRVGGLTLEPRWEDGAMVGFTIDAGRVRGIYFERRDPRR
jgi:CubicO group peptidase (beta-lactamase class C family)